MKHLLSVFFSLFLLGNIMNAQAQVALDWAVPFDGTQTKTASGVATDNDGNVYTVGHFYGKVDFNPSTDPADTFFLTSAGGGNIFVSKLDADGKFLWAKRMGGTMPYGADWAKCVAVDNTGNVYFAGIFYGKADFNPSTDPADTFFLSAGSTGYAYAQDAFVAKLDKDGDFVWAKQFVGYGSLYASDAESANQGRAITVDKATGDVYVTGDFIGKADFNPSPNPADTFFLTAADPENGQDMYITKLDSAGNFVWAKDFGGSSSVMGRGITLDPSGNVLATGYYYNKVDFNPSEAPADTFFLESANKSMDIFVLKLTKDGDFIWAKSMGGPNGSGDLGNAIATDAAGSVYTTGYFSGTDVDFNPGTGTQLFNALHYLDIFVSKLDSAGNFVWAKQMGSKGNVNNISYEESGYGIVINRSGDVLVTGAFADTTDFNVGGTPQTVISNGDRDIFIVSLTNSGDFKWVRTFGGSRYDASWGITIDGSGNIFSTGTYLDTVNFDPPNGPVCTTSGTQANAFVLKLICSDTTSSTLADTTCDNSYTLNGQTYTKSGVYTQKLPNASGCDSTIVLTLTIMPIPHPVINVNGFTLSTAITTYTSYQWLLNGSIINGATNSSYTVTVNGDYQVIVTNEAGCLDTSDIYKVTNAGIEDAGALAQSIQVYPNPATDQVTIQSPVAVDAVLTDISGRAIKQVKNARNISVKDVASGVYLLRITNPQGTLIKVEKIVKQDQ